MIDMMLSVIYSKMYDRVGHTWDYYETVTMKFVRGMSNE